MTASILKAADHEGEAPGRRRPSTSSVKRATSRPPNFLILADLPIAAELMKQALRAAGMDFVAKRVDSRDAFVEMLATSPTDAVLAACVRPDFSNRDALDHVRRTHPKVPVVIVGDAIGDEAAAELLRAGARDYVLKNDLRRLPAALRQAIAIENGVRAGKAAEATRPRLAGNLDPAGKHAR